MFGPHLFARTLSALRPPDRYGNRWQYHSRSDHHSKVACALILLELLRRCPLLRAHAASGKIGFGINHEMREFRSNRKKKLDLVVCTPGQGSLLTGDLMGEIIGKVPLDGDLHDVAISLPPLRSTQVGNVLIALEAKACMTAHQKALPRLYDELNSSHAAVHGASDQAIAVGLFCVNASSRFLSTDLNKRSIRDDPVWSSHPQPKFASIAIEKVRQVPRRMRPGEEGFDALGIVVIDFKNDGSDVHVVEAPPAPQSGDVDHYDRMIDRICSVYAARFGNL